MAQSILDVMPMKTFNRIVMKKFIYSFAALIAAASVLSCQKEPVEVNTENKAEFVYQFNVASAETKAVLKDDATGTYTKFEKDDVLGIYTKTASASVSYNRRGVIDVLDGQPASFKVYSYYALNSGDFVYAYFPYAKGNDDNKTPDSVILEIPVKQNGRMNAMPMVGIPFSVSESINASENTPVGTIYTQNLGGVFQFRIFSSNTSYCTETVKSVEFTSTSDIAGSFAFDITQNTNLEISGNEGKSITVTQDAEVGSDKSHGGLVNMVIKPGSYTGTLVVTTNAATYTFDVSSAKSVERSHIKPLNVDLSKGSRKAYAMMSSFSAISGLVGGDSNVSYQAEKGNASTAPAVNSNQIRVYQNGGLFTVSANNGVTITEIAIGSAMKTSVTYSIDGGTESASSSIAANGKLTVGNIAVSDNIKFKCVGTSTSERLYVNYLYVTYVGGSGEPVLVKLITPVDKNGLNPASGRYDIEGMYELTNIDEDSDPLEVTSSANISNVTAYGGEVEFDMEPNYASNTANGTITLTLKSDPSVTATINVQQSGSTMSTSETEIIIPANGEEAAFNLTCKYFGWTISSDSEDLVFNESGSGSDDPQRITVMSDVEATNEVQTIGTLTIVRNNNSVDPQKKTVVVKKAAAAPEGTPVVLYTLDATDIANTGTDNGYATAENITVNGITWNVTGNATMNPWRIGGKSLDSVDREVYTTTAFSNALTSIDLTLGAASSVTINSIKLVYSVNSDFSGATTVNSDSTSANTTHTFAPEGGFPAECYYKFVFNVTVLSSKNQYIEFKKVEFKGLETK